MFYDESIIIRPFGCAKVQQFSEIPVKYGIIYLFEFSYFLQFYVLLVDFLILARISFNKLSI